MGRGVEDWIKKLEWKTKVRKKKYIYIYTDKKQVQWYMIHGGTTGWYNKTRLGKIITNNKRIMHI